MTPQYFKKSDEVEQQIDAAAAPAFTATSDSKSEMYADCYNAEPFGALIYDSGRSPLSNAINKNVFITTFNELFESFTVAGTIESYISVFKKIFGDDVDLQFEVPAPGKLVINIHALSLVVYRIIGRTIVDEQYKYDAIIDYDGNYPCGRAVKGIESQYELELMLKEMIPAGIFYDINLTIG